jgi:hypothetical protein
MTTIPDGSEIKRIIRLSQAVDPTGMNRNLYMCTGCGATKWGKDREPEQEDWREEHRQECFIKRQPKLEIVREYHEITLTEFYTEFRHGKLGKVEAEVIDPKAKRNIIVRYTKI